MLAGRPATRSRENDGPMSTAQIRAPRRSRAGAPADRARAARCGRSVSPRCAGRARSPTRPRRGSARRRRRSSPPASRRTRRARAGGAADSIRMDAAPRVAEHDEELLDDHADETRSRSRDTLPRVPYGERDKNGPEGASSRRCRGGTSADTLPENTEVTRYHLFYDLFYDLLRKKKLNFEFFISDFQIIIFFNFFNFCFAKIS